LTLVLYLILGDKSRVGEPALMGRLAGRMVVAQPVATGALGSVGVGLALVGSEVGVAGGVVGSAVGLAAIGGELARGASGGVAGERGLGVPAGAAVAEGSGVGAAVDGAAVRGRIGKGR